MSIMSNLVYSTENRLLVNDKELLKIKEIILSQIAQSTIAIQGNDFKTALDLLTDAWYVFTTTPSVQDSHLKITLLYNLCQVYFKRQDFKKLEYYSEFLLDISRQLDDSEKELTALTNIAITRSVFSDYKSAIPMFVEALERSRHLGYRSNAANCLINIGTLYANLFNYEEALDRYNIVLTDYKDVLTDLNRIAIHQNTGNLYHASEQYSLALDYFKKALEVAHIIKAESAMAHANALLSRTYLTMNRLNHAVVCAKLAEEGMSKIENATGRQINYINLAQIALMNDETKRAEKFAKLGIAIARRVKDDASELRGFQLLSNIYQKEDNFHQALRCQRIYSKKQENYLKMQRNMHLLDFEIRYALREKERKIEELTKENQYQALLLERNSQIEKQNEQLRQANEELQQFAYITSHDLKEPLRMIGSYAQIITQHYAPKLGDESKIYFGFINDGVTRMNALLDALLQYATIGRMDLELERVNVADIVSIARTNLKLKIEETYANILCGPMPEVRAIPSFLIQLFQNLIGNAIKFRREDDRPIILINAEEKDNEWLFSVEDNGIGIAPEHQERIFVIFQRLHTRTKYEGTGIGLSICLKIVTQLGGKIWVESESGKGATFFFTIPK